jgi:mannose-1-phosphate guanylyltransferase
VDDETRLARSLREATDVMEAFPDRILLIGMEPGVEMEDYGWIVPGDPIQCGDACTVRCFVEKPDRSTLHELLQRGALVNSLMLTARAGSLGRLIARAAPEVATPLFRSFPHSLGEDGRMRNLYRDLRVRDFSRDVLESFTDSLLVYPAPESCGWSDLGTPSRLGSYLRQKRTREPRRACL